MDVQEVWALLEQHQGEQFYTAKCLPFLLRQYRIILSADTASEVRQMLSQKRR